MKPLKWLTWIVSLVLVVTPVEAAPLSVEPVMDTNPRVTQGLTPTPRRTMTRTTKRTATPTRTLVASPTLRPSRTVVASPTFRPTLKATSAHTATPEPTLGPTATATATPFPSPSATPTPVIPARTPGAPYTPWPEAPLCPDTGLNHNANVFHTLWDASRGCHYDHEHGQNPFTAEVAAAFPGFDLQALMGGVQIGHTNFSGPTENTAKHGGFKWNVQLLHPAGCQGFEGATHGVNGSVIQIHGFGNYAVELEASIHSANALFRQCQEANPNDYGYVYVVQHVSYGEVVSPYQGDLLTYPYYISPTWDPSRGMYLSVGCIGEKLPGQRGDCRDDLAQAQSNRASSTWTTKPTGSGPRPPNSTLLRLLWRVEDTYQMFDWNDQSYPYSFVWLCTADGGVSYNPVGCKYNNSTTQVHEMAGEIPTEWDNLARFDSDPRVGRITAEGYVTRFGTLVPPGACLVPGTDCHPIKMVNAFVGTYGSVLVYTDGKSTNVVPVTPERDIYFCGGVVCDETSFGAVSSGWIGSEN